MDKIQIKKFRKRLLTYGPDLITEINDLLAALVDSGVEPEDFGKIPWLLKKINMPYGAENVE